jgi:hypothetical protein
MYDRSKYPEFWTMSDIQKANADAGRSFFSPDTMRWFRSRVSDEVYQGPGGVFFVTSEQDKGLSIYPRLYTVRQFLPENAEVKTVGDFQQFRNIGFAKRAAKYYATSGLVAI